MIYSKMDLWLEQRVLNRKKNELEISQTCSSFLKIKEMQFKTTLRFHLPQLEWQRITKELKANTKRSGWKKKKKEHPLTDDGISNWWSNSGNQYGESSENLKKKNLPYGQAIPTPGYMPQRIYILHK